MQDSEHRDQSLKSKDGPQTVSVKERPIVTMSAGPVEEMTKAPLAELDTHDRLPGPTTPDEERTIKPTQRPPPGTWAHKLHVRLRRDQQLRTVRPYEKV